MCVHVKKSPSSREDHVFVLKGASDMLLMEQSKSKYLCLAWLRLTRVFVRKVHWVAVGERSRPPHLCESRSLSAEGTNVDVHRWSAQREVVTGRGRRGLRSSSHFSVLFGSLLHGSSL